MPLSDPISSSRDRVLHFQTLDSTNAEAMRRAGDGEAAPFWIVADVQSQGRGRSGRRWTSEPGNLLASLLIILKAPAPKAYQLSLVAGIAAVDAIRSTMTLTGEAALRLKWPNDILIGGAKAGGILVESSARGDGLAAAIGMGINIVSHPPDLDRPATHLAAHGSATTAGTMLDALGAAMEQWLALWSEGSGMAAIRHAWLERAGPIGEALAINTGRESLAGTFAGLDADGALLLRDAAGNICTFSFGDVSLAG